MCTMELMKDGSAVKKEMRGKRVSVWVEKVPKQLFVGRPYLLLNCGISKLWWSEISGTVFSIMRKSIPNHGWASLKRSNYHIRRQAGAVGCVLNSIELEIVIWKLCFLNRSSSWLSRELASGTCRSWASCFRGFLSTGVKSALLCASTRVVDPGFIGSSAWSMRVIMFWLGCGRWMGLKDLGKLALKICRIIFSRGVAHDIAFIEEPWIYVFVHGHARTSTIAK